MKSSSKSSWFTSAAGMLPALLVAAVLGGVSTLQADQPTKVIPPNANTYDSDYAGWSAKWWQWFLSQPLEGHPGTDTPDFDVTAGQSGDVWFLGSPFGTVERSCTIPAGKALFFSMANSECSSLEAEPFHGDTAKEQRVCAKFWTDHFEQPFCEIDGKAVSKPESYRVTSPQFTFTAPSPWIYGADGGTGTAVADGYYILLTPLSPGEHTVRYGGLLRYTLEVDGFDGEFPIDTTYHLTVE